MCFNFILDLNLTNVLISMSTLSSLVVSLIMVPPYQMILLPLFQFSIISGKRIIAIPHFAPW